MLTHRRQTEPYSNTTADKKATAERKMRNTYVCARHFIGRDEIMKQYTHTHIYYTCIYICVCVCVYIKAKVARLGALCGQHVPRSITRLTKMML